MDFKPIQTMKTMFVNTTIILLVLAMTASAQGMEKPEREKPNSRLEKSSPVRTFPFCVDEIVLDKYKPNLDEGPLFNEYLRVDALTRIGTRTQPILPCLGCGDGLIDKFDMFRIHVAPTDYYTGEVKESRNYWNLTDSIYKSLQQWFHIHLVTTEPVQGVLVQSMAGYQGLPHGLFNVEFGCLDCGMSNDELMKGITEDVLALGGKAAVIPCKRRTYLHARHPNVYMYANTKNANKTDFHFHFNYLDIGCRDMKTIQFMILIVKQFGQGSNKTRKSSPAERFSRPHAQYVYTPAIDHNFADSIEGAPYPYHVSFRNRFKCHVPDSDLPPGVPVLRHTLAINGDVQVVRMHPDYDKCLVEGLDKNLEPNGADGTWLSNLICMKPVRTRCNYDSDVARTTDNKCKANPKKACVCIVCTHENNDFTRQVLPRLIRRGYMARRFHGIAMITGCMTLTIVSIHIARYFKEAGGGCILVGWWFWIHAGLSYLSFGAIWTGFVMGLTAQRRPTNNYGIELLDDRRHTINLIHKLIGAVAIVFFHINFWLGPFRPAKYRSLLMWLHTAGGYLVIVIGGVATFVSVACREIKLYVLGMCLITWMPWGIACFLQQSRDWRNKLNPPRSYYPVIEAIRIDKVMPQLVPRFCLVLLTALICTVVMFLSTTAGGYNGLGIFGHCSNCIWKYDDIIVLSKNDTFSDFSYFATIYNCSRSGWQGTALLF